MTWRHPLSDQLVADTSIVNAEAAIKALEDEIKSDDADFDKCKIVKAFRLAFSTGHTVLFYGTKHCEALLAALIHYYSTNQNSPPDALGDLIKVHFRC